MGKSQHHICNQIQTVLLQARQEIENGRLDRAETHYRWALNILPSDPQLHLTLGLLLLERGRIDPAIAEIAYATQLEPNNANAFRGLGDALDAAEQTDSAIAAYQRACALDPENTDALLNLGIVFQKSDQYENALSTFQDVLDLEPEHPKALNNIGKTFHDMGHLERALKYYTRALDRIPSYAEAHFNRSVARITLGDYANGWSEYEWRFKRKLAKRVYPHQLFAPRWQGQNYAGHRLLVHCEQGFGDVLQFARYLPLAKQLGGTLIVEAHPPLLPVLQNLRCIDQLIPFDVQNPPTEHYDLQAPLLSLPFIIGTDINSIPIDFPYLRPDKAKSDFWKSQISTTSLRIGIVWASSAVNPKRNFPLQHCLAWQQIPGVHFYSLQKGPAAKQIQKINPHFFTQEMGDKLHDFGDTAALIENLDLVISVDTAVAHLTGAMGKPLWVLLPHVSDWRWPKHLQRSPWYPAAKLFRQSMIDDWKNVSLAVKNALETLTKTQIGKSLAIEKPTSHAADSCASQMQPSASTPTGLRKIITRPLPSQPTIGPNYNQQWGRRPGKSARSKIKKVMLISPIYGGSMEVMRYLTAGFQQAGLTTRFLDNSSHYLRYQQLTQNARDEFEKQQKTNQMLAELDQRLLSTAARFKPDLLIAIAQSPLDNQTVLRLRQSGIICVYWFVEDYRFRKYWSQIAPAYDHFFMIQRDCHLKSKFKRMGYANWHYLPLACEPSIHKPWFADRQARRSYECQIGFMGAPYLNRLNIFDQLTHFDLRIWGEGWGGHELSRALKACIQEGNTRISCEESVKIYSSAQILVNLHSSPFDKGISSAGDFVNPRTFEVAGCGGFQLTDYRRELPELFEPGKEIILFHDMDELQSQITYYLSHQQQRRQVSQRAQARVYAQHTYRHRAQQMLRIIEESE